MTFTTLERFLWPEYEKYLVKYRRIHRGVNGMMSFDDCWRAQADNVKEQREGK